jgi:hypothetical protein
MFDKVNKYRSKKYLKRYLGLGLKYILIKIRQTKRFIGYKRGK